MKIENNPEKILLLVLDTCHSIKNKTLYNICILFVVHLENKIYIGKCLEVICKYQANLYKTSKATQILVSA